MNRTTHRPMRPGIGARILGLFAGITARRRQRLDLMRLDDHLLDDIGLSRDMVEAELARFGWEAPAHWRERIAPHLDPRCNSARQTG